MSVYCCAVSQSLVILNRCQQKPLFSLRNETECFILKVHHQICIHLSGLLQMASVVFLDVVPGADGGLQFISHHHAGPLCWGATGEQHHTGPCVRKSSLRVE